MSPQTTPQADTDHEAHEPSSRLMSATFVGLLVTQFLGATNDNLLRWLVIGIGKQHVEQANISMILAVGSGCFVLPYLLLAAPAGYLADRFNKRTVIVACKVAEVVIMGAAVAAILISNKYLLFVVVALMGAQSALFGPSKLGSIPEMLKANKISSANGMVGLTTVVATVVGATLGNWLASPEVTGAYGLEGWWISALVMLSVAGLGLAASLWIMPLRAANPSRTFPWDMVQQTVRDLRTLAEERAMLRVALGIMFFWTLGMLATLNIDQFAFEGGATDQKQVSALLGALVVGVGLGSVLAGVWSGGKVELGILPLGAGGLAVFSFLLYTVEGTLVDPGEEYTLSYIVACGFLVLLGVSSGLFDVPLAAYMQHRSQPEKRGAILAASNFLTFGGMLVASVGYYLLRRPPSEGASPLFSPREIFLLCGLATIPVFIYIVLLIPQASIKFLAWLVTHSVYRIRLLQRENLPEQGGALLTPNHVSWLDGLLLLTTSSRPVRIVIGSDLMTNWWTRGLGKLMGVIPISRSPKAARHAIETARDALRAGELVCIFPEGGITRSGQLQSFKPGMLKILKGTDAPVIPVYFDELWGSIFSFRGGKFFWKWPSGWTRRVSIWFGKPMSDPQDVHDIRQAVQDLGAEAVSGRKKRTEAMPRAMIRMCRKAMIRWKVADSTGAELSGGQLLMRTLILRRLLQRHVFSADERNVGLLLPPSVGGMVANAAVSMTGRVTANLNYTSSSDVLDSCIERAEIRHVLTSRKFMEKMSFDLNAELVYLEDFRDQVTLWDKVVAGLGAYLAPAVLLERMLGLQHIEGDDVLTIIFTSGSTGVPKGVMLTHHNIATNVEAVELVVDIQPEDTVLGIVPFFHSLGFMVTLWGALALDLRVAYHFSPLDARQIGKLALERQATILLATPTFLRSYLRRCEPEQFEALNVVVTGAEALPLPVCEAFEKKFGVRPVEGYGATELSPLVSVNVPPNRSQSLETDSKDGSVGRPVPGVSVKVVDPESFEPLPRGTAGMLLVTGPNVMKGYLGQEDKTAEVIRDGWYVTGDIAEIDEQGFVFITGRVSRFAKIGGEMIPLVRIEEVLHGILHNEEDEDEEGGIVMAAVPDQRKGERLIVLHESMPLSPEDVCKRLAEAGLPNLWIPSTDSFLEVESIPLLGSGKTDLKAVSDLAMKHFGPPDQQAQQQQ